MITISNCQFGYAKELVLNIEALQIQEGEHIFIHGKSGSGKSTFLNMLCGILVPQSGSIEVLGKRVDLLSSPQRDTLRANNYGTIFQQFNLLPYLSIEENISLACAFSKEKRANIINMKDEIRNLLDALELNVPINTPAMNLSVGEQQRVAVARALIGKPKIIIADEPTSALDSSAKESFMQLLFQQVNAQKSTLIFVSHDKSLAGGFNTIYDFAEINRVSK